MTACLIERAWSVWSFVFQSEHPFNHEAGSIRPYTHMPFSPASRHPVLALREARLRLGGEPLGGVRRFDRSMQQILEHACKCPQRRLAKFGKQRRRTADERQT